MWYEVLQSDLILINYMKRGERISIVQKNKIEDPEIYIHYYEASLSECRSLAICESRSLVPLHEEPRDTKIRGKNGEISNAQCIKTKKLILKDLNFKRRKK